MTAKPTAPASDYFSGVAAETVGSHRLCLHTVTIPPLGRAKPHLHENREGLREHVWMRAGDFLYIPANTPHLPLNPSNSEPCVDRAHRPERTRERHVAGYCRSGADGKDVVLEVDEARSPSAGVSMGWSDGGGSSSASRKSFFTPCQKLLVKSSVIRLLLACPWYLFRGRPLI
jgi:hypothetical protein